MPIELAEKNRSYTNQAEDSKEFVLGGGKGSANKCAGCGAPVPGACSCTGACKGCRACKGLEVESNK